MRLPPPRCRLLRACAPALALAAALAFGGSARAEGLPSLAVHRTDDTSDCPDAAALAGRVARHMKRPALDPRDAASQGGAASLDVQIYRSEKGFTAVVQSGEKTRQLTDEGSTCAGLADALAITLAILLDTEPPPPSPAPSPEPAAPPTPAPRPTRREPIAPDRLPPDPAASEAADASPEPPPDPPKPPPRLYAGLAVASSVGLLQAPLGLGIEGYVGVGAGRVFSFEGGFLALPARTSLYPGRVKGTDGTTTPLVEVSLAAGLLRACAGPPAFAGGGRLSGCFGPVLGAIHGAGLGFPSDKTVTVPWFAAEAGALYVQPLVGRLALAARGSLFVPLVRQSFTVTDVDQGNPVAFSPAPVGGALDAELRLTIW
jgi:hypothetical protein